MRKITPPRKIKARLHLLLLLVSIFLTTLIVCGIVFSIFLFSNLSLISPVSMIKSASVDGQIGEVQLFCQQNHMQCASVQSTDATSIQITMDDNALVILSTKKDIKKQLSSLQEVTSQLTIKGKQFKKLDFRFANTVVTF